MQIPRPKPFSGACQKLSAHHDVRDPFSFAMPRQSRLVPGTQGEGRKNLSHSHAVKTDLYLNLSTIVIFLAVLVPDFPFQEFRRLSSHSLCTSASAIHTFLILLESEQICRWGRSSLTHLKFPSRLKISRSLPIAGFDCTFHNLLSQLGWDQSRYDSQNLLHSFC